MTCPTCHGTGMSVHEPQVNSTCPHCGKHVTFENLVKHVQEDCKVIKSTFTRCNECHMLVKNADLEVHNALFCKARKTKNN